MLRSIVSVSVAALATMGLVSAASQARAEDHLKVAVGARGVGETFVPELGQNAGIFKKYGLSLEILYTQGGGETQQVVISNSAQIGVAVGFSGTLAAFAKGAPVRIIGSTFTGGSQLFWYVPANSPIKTVQDAAGKTVAYSTHGSSTHTAVLALQKHFGVPFKPTPTGAAPGTFTQVMSGQIDVGWAGAPFGIDTVEAGKTRVLMKASDDPELNRQTIRLMIANADELKNHKDVFVRYMRAYREALAWVYSTPEGLKAYAKWASIPENVAKRALAEFLPKDAVDPDRISGVDDVMKDAVTFKYIPKPLSKEQLDELIQIPERKG
ncbi:MAG TPA: ABC transporter substrate-binding protein [Xanthobacteraceae bacterium]|nr:ABC transporter substrate-binding protein [Xanthobacteraceae bacterium]